MPPTVAGARMSIAVFEAPDDSQLQYLVSGQGTPERNELMIERLDARSGASHAERMFFRRQRATPDAWGRWLPM